MEDVNFENSLKLPKFTLSWAGIPILTRKDVGGLVNFVKSWIFYINLSCLGPDLLGEIYWLIEGMYKGESLDELCMNASCSSVNFLSVVKLSCLYFNRDVVKSVIEKLRSIHPTDDQEELIDTKRKIITDALRFLNIVMKFFCYSAVAVIVVFSIAPALSMAYQYYETGITEFKFPLRVKYFFEISTLRQWVLVYVHQVCSMSVSCLDLLSTDILFYALCTYIQMHFRLLCLQLENAVTENAPTETNEKFRKAVKRHQDLIFLVEQIELLYSKSILCNFILSSLLICLSGFVVTFVHDVDTVSCFVVFLVTSLIQVSLLCYFGDMLNSTSTGISRAIYDCQWYNAEINVKRSVLIVMFRAQRPCKLTAMKFADLNLNALSAILKTSWSYFALLKTMHD